MTSIALRRELVHLGLSEKEATVYLTSLELGPAPVQVIAGQAAVNRATTYVVIESLAERGLMSVSIKGNKRLFTAEHPERLLTILRLQKKEIEEKEREFQRVFPTIQALFHAQGKKPDVRYLEGVEGVKAVRALFERLDGEAVQLFSLDDAKEIQDLDADRRRHVQALQKQRDLYRIIAVADHEPDQYDLPELGGATVRFVTRRAVPMRGEVTVRVNHVFLFSYSTPVLAVVIVSQDVADSMRAMFELAWRGAEGEEREI